MANSVSLLLLKQFREMTSSASAMSMFPTRETCTHRWLPGRRIAQASRKQPRATAEKRIYSGQTRAMLTELWQGKSEVLDFWSLNQPTHSSGKSSVRPIPQFAEALDFLLPRRDGYCYQCHLSSSVIQQLALFGLIGDLARKRRPPWSISRFIQAPWLVPCAYVFS